MREVDRGLKLARRKAGFFMRGGTMAGMNQFSLKRLILAVSFASFGAIVRLYRFHPQVFRLDAPPSIIQGMLVVSAYLLPALAAAMLFDDESVGAVVFIVVIFASALLF
jgi:hypothetical protein